MHFRKKTGFTRAQFDLHKEHELNTKTSLGACRLAVKIADPQLMREINKYHVLETIRCHSRISRVEISERTLLSGTTVSAITGALIEEGLVQAIHMKRPEDGRRGRPRVLLDLIPDAAHVIGVKISSEQITTTIANFKGEAVYSMQMPVKVASRSIDAIVDVIENSIHVCVAAHGIDRNKIKGIGIGVPDRFDLEASQKHSRSIFADDDFPLANLLEERLGLRTRMAKPADLVALAESWFGYAQNNHSFAAITIDQAVGLALWIDDDLHKGATTLGSAFGHIKTGQEGRHCRCGQRDCLDAYMEVDVTQLRKELAEAVQSEHHKSDNTTSQLITLAAAENPWALEQIGMQGKMLGVGVSHIINLINPEKIVMVTEDDRYESVIRKFFYESVRDNSFSAHFEATEIIFHTINEQLWARGAAALMLRDIYRAPWNDVAKDT